MIIVAMTKEQARLLLNLVAKEGERLWRLRDKRKLRLEMGRLPDAEKEAETEAEINRLELVSFQIKGAMKGGA